MPSASAASSASRSDAIRSDVVGLSIIIVAWVYWPSNKKRYERAAATILQDDDRPLP